MAGVLLAGEYWALGGLGYLVPPLIEIADPDELSNGVVAEAVLEADKLPFAGLGDVFEPFVRTDCKAAAQAGLGAHLAQLSLGDAEPRAELLALHPSVAGGFEQMLFYAVFEVHHYEGFWFSSSPIRCRSSWSSL